MARPSYLSAISTPFRPDGDPDLDAFSAHLEWLAEAGLDGVFVAGTTGEGVLLEDDEVAALVERAVAGDGLRIVAQVGRPSTRATVRLARRAIELGAHAVAAYVPWFYPATEADVRRHFLALLEAAGDTPAFLYTIPRRTGNDLPAGLAGELARAGYAGMKDSTADFARHEAYLEALAGRDFELFIGSEPLVLRACRLGAAGAVTGLAGCRPELFAGLRDALAADDDAAAERVQAEITAAKEEVEAEGSTVAAVKRRVAAALAERGVDYPAAPRAPFG
jgi:dihydrodipicolinate synthase/N-acetylneuraminate lyase